jgi:hypothetical protein
MKMLLENIKQKRLAILKAVLLTTISANAGFNFYLRFVTSLYNANFLNSLNQFIGYLGIHKIEYVKNVDYFFEGIPQYFFLFMLVSLSQWILLSEKLPPKWLSASLVGAIVAGILVSASQNLLFVPQYPLMELRVDFLNGCFLAGFLATIPQWLLLNKRQKAKSYYWLIINGVGWGVIGLFLYQELAISYTFGFGKVNVMIFDLIRYYRLWYIVDFCSFIPLGIGTGLFFMQLEAKEHAEA